MFCINKDVFSSHFQTAQSSHFFQISDFVAGMGILCSKLEVCLPLAYHSTIYKHFSSLKPLVGTTSGGTNPKPLFWSWASWPRARITKRVGAVSVESLLGVLSLPIPAVRKKTKSSNLAFNRFCTKSKVFNNAVSYITSTGQRSCSRWIFSDSCSKRNTNAAAWNHFAPETCLNLIEVDQNKPLIKY